MEIRCAALGYDAYLSAGSPPILGGVVGGQHLDLFGRIHVGHADTGAISAGAHGGCAIHGDDGVLRSRAIDFISAVGQAEIEVAERRAGLAAAAHAGKKLRHIDRIAAIELLVLDLTPGHLRLHCSGFGLQHFGGG